MTSLTRGSSCCSSPGCAATSSLKMAWRISEVPPFSVFSTKLPFLRLPMQPHGHIPTSGCTNQSGVAGRLGRVAIMAWRRRS